MGPIANIRLMLRITRAASIARRYFVVNGFDGALTMLGLNMGFYVSRMQDIQTAITACLGTAIALAMSGLSSAYVSEAAEKRRELASLERAMMTSLSESTHARAARIVPWLIAGVNGFAPFFMALVIILPLWFAHWGITLPMDPFVASIAVSFVVIFMLGVFLGRVSGISWFFSGLKTLAVAAVTALLIWSFRI
jgi:predicted membrane protein (TIGR00267 family)